MDWVSAAMLTVFLGMTIVDKNGWLSFPVTRRYPFF
jgi:hypothetical protein